jgi:exopolysaccharide biosynthesis predicted pyruvyltransferase EpsI
MIAAATAKSEYLILLDIRDFLVVVYGGVNQNDLWLKEWMRRMFRARQKAKVAGW